MNEQIKKISILGILFVVLVLVVVYMFPQDDQKIQTQDIQKENLPETTVKNFYDWYENESIGVLDDAETITKLAKEKGFVTQEFVISTMYHPLVVKKKADVVVCASKKDLSAFPITFIPFPSTSSTDVVKVEATSKIPNHKINILVNTKEDKIFSITCPVIPNL